MLGIQLAFVVAVTAPEHILLGPPIARNPWTPDA